MCYRHTDHDLTFAKNVLYAVAGFITGTVVSWLMWWLI